MPPVTSVAVFHSDLIYKMRADTGLLLWFYLAGKILKQASLTVSVTYIYFS